jgi:predicted dehydrogenase
MSQRKTRRKFLKTSAAAGVGFWVAGGMTPRESLSANEEIRFASIGVGGKGSSDSSDAGRSGKMVAICDIDQSRLDGAGKKFTDAKKFDDYRKMLDEMHKNVDAVTVSTPDHNHFVASSRAIKHGLHCFTQKPLSHTIWEARELGRLAKEHKVATMMGNQGTANSGLREAAALIKGGVLGTIQEVHVWTNRPVWPQGLGRPTETPDVPAGINWDCWIGPAKERPYHQAYHPFKWRGWWDFGTGALGDMACHTFNMPYAGCDLFNPTSVVAETAGHNKETYPAWSIIDFVFPANDWRPEITCSWYDGGKRPDAAKFSGKKLGDSNSGALIIGDKGKLYSPGDYADKYELIGVEKKDVEYKRSPGHFREWVDAIKGGDPAMSNFPEYAGPLTETILLGNLAVWADGKKIEWDAKNLVATNAPEVASIVNKEYRNGWEG